jgi:putative ABC transport system permease protein
MTALRERTATRARPVRRGGAGRRWRVAARMARRQVLRTRLSSLLVVLLVALPIGAMSAYAVFAASVLATPEERVVAELGRAEAWIAPGGVAGAGLWQSPTAPTWTGYPQDADGAYRMPDGELVTDPTTALPAGTDVLSTRENGRVRVDSADGIALIAGWTGPVWDPVLTGRFAVVDGRPPASASEAMVTPAALERLGTSIGGRLTLADVDETYRIVGTLDATGVPDDQAGVFLPDGAAADAAVGGGERRWYLPDTELTWPDVQRLNDEGVVALSRAVVLDPPAEPPRAFGGMNPELQQMLTLVITVAVGGAFAGYVVVMLAGAAFAVTARRQQRALAIAAGVGASRHDLFRIVTLQGTVLGTVGGVLGTAGGVGVAALVLHLIDDGSGMSPWGVHVPWPFLAGILAFAVVVGTLSAVLPARAAARADAIGALRGARRPQRPTAARPLWGSIVLVSGVGLTIACAAWLAAVSATEISGDSPVRYLPVWGIVVGPILAQIGILLSGRWLLWLTSRVLSRTSTAARLASRDAAANAARTIPAFAAVGATVFIGVFAAASSGMSTAASARSWYYPSPVGTAAISVQPADQGNGTAPVTLDADQTREAFASARRLAESAGATTIATVSAGPSPWRFSTPADVPADATVTMAVVPSDNLLDPRVQDSFSGSVIDPANNLSVIAAADLETALGVRLSAAQLAEYRDGAVVIVDPRLDDGDGEVQIGTWAAEAAARGALPTNIWTTQPGDAELADPIRTERRPAITVSAPQQPLAAAIAPATATELGVDAQPTTIVAAFEEPLSIAQSDQLNGQAALAGTRDALVQVSISHAPPGPYDWLIPLLGTVSVLVVGASAVALGLARFERRPDDATLAAVGGTPGLRRRLGFWQALIIAGFGTATGAVTGILPAIGVAIQSRGGQQLTDVPWLLLAALVVALPLAIAAVNALVPPRRPELTRRTAIA